MLVAFTMAVTCHMIFIPQGDRGFPAQDGTPGQSGHPGPKGESGLSVIGEPGIPGFRGDKGDKGEPGSYGLKGEPGFCPPANITEGLKGERGLVGDKGEPGPPGRGGLPGDRGLQGFQVSYSLLVLRVQENLTGLETHLPSVLHKICVPFVIIPS